MEKVKLPVNEIVFQQDTADRKYWFKAASFAHPAKMVLGLQLYLIEHYTKKGDTILDPMAGSGTILVACAIGRNVICIELEKKFVKMQQDNWEKIKALGPMLGYTMGQAQIVQGDARNLDDVLADCAIFSPPYANRIGNEGDEKHRHFPGDNNEKYMATYPPNKNNIGNLPYGSISAVISSPPYEGSLANENPDRKPNYWQNSGGYQSGKGTETYADLDPSIKRLRAHGRTDDKAGGPYGRSLGHPYSGAVENIGNLKSENYLQAMLLVYQGCFRVLKPEGFLILVTKNFIRNKAIVRLDLDTIKLCEQAGFVLVERLKRKLMQMSFWRRIYMQKYPDAPRIDFEDVLVFRKRTV